MRPRLVFRVTQIAVIDFGDWVSCRGVHDSRVGTQPAGLRRGGEFGSGAIRGRVRSGGGAERCAW